MVANPLAKMEMALAISTVLSDDARYIMKSKIALFAQPILAKC
jgi:hypothetical protein